jgi:hypothetical protein
MSLTKLERAAKAMRAEISHLPQVQRVKILKAVLAWELARMERRAQDEMRDQVQTMLSNDTGVDEEAPTALEVGTILHKEVAADLNAVEVAPTDALLVEAEKHGDGPQFTEGVS